MSGAVVDRSPRAVCAPIIRSPVPRHIT